MKHSLHYTIQQYCAGTLDPRAMHELEKMALEDEFLADALEGYHSVRADEQHLSMLQKQLHERVAKKHLEKVKVSTTAQRISIAAVASVIFILATILFWMRGFNTPEVTKAKATSVSLNKQELSTLESEARFIASVSGNTAPVVGWKEYEEYIQRNMRIPHHAVNSSSSVNVEFTVDLNGKQSNYKILKSISPAHDAEAIRLIDEGPSWRPAVDGKPTKAVLSITFNK